MHGDSLAISFKPLAHNQVEMPIGVLNCIVSKEYCEACTVSKKMLHESCELQLTTRINILTSGIGMTSLNSLRVLYVSRS